MAAHLPSLQKISECAATPNAMANMDAVVSKYGHSQKAYLVVPIVGAFLIDVFVMPIILTSINLFS